MYYYYYELFQFIHWVDSGVRSVIYNISGLIPQSKISGCNLISIYIIILHNWRKLKDAKILIHIDTYINILYSHYAFYIKDSISAADKHVYPIT